MTKDIKDKTNFQGTCLEEISTLSDSRTFQDSMFLKYDISTF